MVRRAPSASRSSSRRTRFRDDGKVDIHCPQCGAHFRLPATALEAKVTCSECTRTFFAHKATGGRPAAADHSRVYLGFGLGAAVVIGSLVMMSRRGSEPAPKAAVATAASQANKLEADRKLRQEQAMRWARAVAAKDLFTLRSYSDMTALLATLGVPSNLRGEELDAAIQQALSRNEATRLFTEMECLGADVGPAALQAGAGTMSFRFVSRPGDRVYESMAKAQVTVQWRLDDTQFRVSSFQLTVKPLARGTR